MEGLCEHCRQVRQVTPVGSWYLCDEHKYLKQYQPRDKQKTSVNKQSDKRGQEIHAYKVTREHYLNEHVRCEVKGCNQKATEIHHMKGRQGYADKQAIADQVTLLCDARFFLAVCRDCHHKIERNPRWAKDQGYSKSRTT